MSTKSKKEKRTRRYTDAKKVNSEMDSFKPTSFKAPKGVEVFRFREEKTYRLDIIPFVTGEGNPAAEAGYDHYERRYYAHKNIGPNRDLVVCPAKTFDKDCPICEHRARIKQDEDGDPKLFDELKPQLRHLWLVYDYDDPEKGVQIMDTAHWKSFGEMLKDKIDASEEDDNFENFFHLEEGMTLRVTVKEDTFNGKTFMKVSNIEMKPRKKPLDPELTDNVPCLDELLIELSYKELEKKFNAIAASKDDEDEDDDEGESEKSSKKGLEKSSGGSKKKDDDDEDDEDDPPKKKKKVKDEDEDDEDEEEKPKKKKPTKEEDDEVDFEEGDRVAGEYKNKPFKGTVKEIINGLVKVKTDDSEIRTCDPEELEKLSENPAKKKASKEEDDDDDEGEDEEDNRGKKSKSSKGSSMKASDEDDDEDEDEDEKPAKKKKSKDEDDEDDD